MTAQLYRIGMVGLGVMGRSMVLNMADHGFPVAGYDKDLSKGKGDKKKENDEYFLVRLSNASSNALIDQEYGYGTILDDDRRR